MTFDIQEGFPCGERAAAPLAAGGDAMLLTITKGKAGRLQLPGTDALLSWRDVFKGREDLLTGVIFGRLRFLSTAAMSQVMGYFLGADYAASLGDFKHLDLWPQLKNLEGRSWVEPDVLLTFDHALVLIEVKPPSGGLQTEQQWRNEILALDADEASETVGRVHFVALGNTRRVDGPIELSWGDGGLGMDLSCHAREWDSLVLALQAMHSQATGADAAVFDDWRDALELFGLVPAPRHWSDLVLWSARHSFELAGVWPANDERELTTTDRKNHGWKALLDMSESTRMELPRWT